MKHKNKTWLVVLVLATQVSGCESNKTLHEKHNWNASEHFDDSNVIQLCHAIEAKDIELVKKLVESGVDINNKGKGNVTPLLWAFIGDNFEILEYLLKQGANPNVVIDIKKISLKAAFTPRDSVTHLAARTHKLKHFEAVFSNGGDPNLLGGRSSGSTLHSLVQDGEPHQAKKLRKLIEYGADPNKRDSSGATPAMLAISWFGQYHTALLLLESGADPGIYSKHVKLTHFVAGEKKRAGRSPEKMQEHYSRLVEWLDDHGESVSQAHADIKRWNDYREKHGRKAWDKLLEKEIRERLSRESAENEPENLPTMPPVN